MENRLELDLIEEADVSPKMLPFRLGSLFEGLLLWLKLFFDGLLTGETGVLKVTWSSSSSLSLVEAGAIKTSTLLLGLRLS